MTYYKIQHRMTMVDLKNVVKRYILQWFDTVIEFLIHNSGYIKISSFNILFYDLYHQNIKFKV